MYEVVVIPVDGKLYRVRINDSESLDSLQKLVGGNIEALPFPEDDRITAYINEEGKYVCVDDDGRVEVNLIGTQVMAPVLWPGDFIAGPLIVCGFDPQTGENEDCPKMVDILATFASARGL